MAKIPTEQSTAQITTQAGRVRQGQGVFSSKVAQETQKIGDAITAVAQKFEDARALSEKAKADTEGQRRFRALQVLSETSENQDPAFYQNQISKIREDTSKLITQPKARAEYQRDFDRDAVLFDFSIQKTLRNRIASEGVANINENTAQLRDNFINGSPEIQVVAETKADMLLDGAVRNGFITSKEAQIKKADRNKEWQLARIDADIERDASQAIEDLQAGEDGIYADVDAGDRNTKLASANTKLNRDKAIANRNVEVKQEQAESDMAISILDEKVTENDVNQAELLGQVGAVGGISKDFAAAARRAVKSAASVDAKTKGDMFNRLQDEFVALNIKVKTRKGVKKFSTKANVRDIAKFRTNVIEAYNEGSIEPAVGRNWLVAVSNVFDKALNKEVKKEFKEDLESEKIDTIQNLWSKISFWSDEFADDKAEVKARLGQEFMGRLMNTEQDGDEIVDDLIVKEQKNKNPNRALYKIDQTINTPLGPAKVIGFDGDGEPIVDNEKIRALTK